MLAAKAWTSGPASIAMRGVLYAFAPAKSDAPQYCLNEINTIEIQASLDETSDWIVPEHEVIRLLVEAFKQVPQVSSICAQFGSDGIAIWTLLREYDRDARQAVYEKELQLCEGLGACDFDFRVSSIDLVTPEELVQAGSREIFKRA